jgi:uncharacterized repeat protein (TIGR01451 family)
VHNSIGDVRVEFYSGSTRLQSVTNSPFQFTWPNPSAGDYSLTARATDSQGNTASSTPVAITISEICGDVAIVQNFADPEISRLQDYLFEMGLSSRVFDQAGLTFEALQRYRLIIWDDLGTTTNGLSANDVQVFQKALTAGIPLYLIGERLAASTANLTEPERSEWIALTHLIPAHGMGGDGTVHVQSSVPFNRVLDGRFLTATDFPYPPELDVADLADADAEVMGFSAAANVLVCYPTLVTPDTGQVRSFTQNLRVLAEPQTTPPPTLKGLFQNVVCWLLRCPDCSDIDLWIEGTGPDSAQAGQVIQYTLNVLHSGECEAIATVVTDVLPPGVQFVSAESELGTWSFDADGSQVVFKLGHLARGFTGRVSLKVLALRTGSLTNQFNVRSGGPEITLDNNQGSLVTSVQGGAVPIPDRLNLRSASSGILVLDLLGDSNLNYIIEASNDLNRWTSLTNATGPKWEMLIPLSRVLGSQRSFFRTRIE